MKTTLIVLTYNEMTGMPVIMPRIQNDWVDQIIILDGGSTDGTIEWARENGYFVYIQQKKGIRHAYVEALPLIEGDVVITFSPDGNSIPELLPDLIAKMQEGYDMVIVSRYKDNAKSEDDDIVTSFGNWFFTTAVNVLHHAKYTDAMVIYRAFKKELVYDLELHLDAGYTIPEKLFFTRVSWEPLMSVRAAKAKLRVDEIPGDEPPRIGGERKLQVIRWGLTFLFQFIWEVFFWRPKNRSIKA